MVLAASGDGRRDGALVEAHRRYGQGEVVIVESILAAAGTKAEAYASHLIEGEESDAEEIPSVTVASLKSVSVDVETLQDALVAAVGPTNSAGVVPEAPKANE